MSHHRILRRRDYEREVSALPLGVQRKAEWATLQLGARGRTPSTKSTVGLNMRWRRSPVQGSHYYLWWIPASDTGIELNGSVDLPEDDDASTILVHSIRHHDETGSAIDVGDIAEYSPVELGLLDPRFDEQTQVAAYAERENVSFASIEGMPGSGKSVALLFLARDLALNRGVQKIRYITYSDRLKREAREIFDSFGPQISEHIVVSTFHELLRDLLRLPRASTAVAHADAQEQRDFVAELERTNAAQLGRWRAYPDTLYTELRGYVIGRSLPRGYNIPKHKHELLRRSGDSIDVDDYARKRKFDPRSAQIAVTQGERLRDKYFIDQNLAFDALQRLMRGDAPNWLFGTDALIVDEVQDLTLLQIALIGEMAAARRARHPERPFVLTVAGDESQIVQPTGFQWGVTKNLLGERLAVHPQRVGFQSQRRSPLAIARLMDRSWDLYASLPRDLRPSAQKSVTALEEGGEAEEAGVVAFVSMSSNVEGSTESKDWRRLLTAMTRRPGRALIDLESALAPHRTAIDAVDGAAEVVFDPREIKGLERATVLVTGLQAANTRLDELLEDDEQDRIAALEARRLIDQMRVALSRSTNRLIFLEDRNQEIYRFLGVDETANTLTLDLDGLIALLDADELTEVEMVEGMLDEAADLADRGRSEDARSRNRRAAEMAEQLRVPLLQRRAREQYAEFLLADAERALDVGDVAVASRHLTEAANTLNVDHLAAQYANYRELQQRIAAASQDEYARLVESAEKALAAERWAEAMMGAQSAFDLARGDEGSLRRQESSEILMTAVLRHTLDLARRGETVRAATLLDGLLEVAVIAQSPKRHELVHLISHYHSAEDPSDSLETDLASLSLAFGIAGKPGIIEEISEESAAHLNDWVATSFALLEDKLEYYLDWAEIATVAEQRTGYPDLDERIWDLENRWNLRKDTRGVASNGMGFEAFLAAYNGDHARASELWEESGDLARAVDAARAAGDLERTSALYRRQNKPAPEEVATAVKFVRQAQQLQHKYGALTPAERRTLLEELARLHTELSDTAEEAF